MAWSAWYTSFSDAFKKRAGRYLINKYLGTFLDETISLDQLSVDGAISLSNVALNIPTINGLIEEADLPVEFVDGYIADLSVSIPWSNLLTESCFFSISGLTVTLQVKKRANPAQISASIFHSMCESFSSFSVAEECLKQEDVQASPGKRRNKQGSSEEDIVAGVELLAQAIDSVIMRVQVKLSDSCVRLEYLPGLEQRGIALELQVGKIIYSGEVGEKGKQEQEESFSTSTVRKIQLEDVSLLTDEFHLSGCSPSSEEQQLDLPLRLASLAGSQELVLKFTEINQFGLPRAVDEVEVGLGLLKFHIYPHQVHILSEIASAVTVPVKPSTVQTVRPPRHHRHMTQGLEGLLQENLRFGTGQKVGLNAGWGEDLDSSREFLPVVGGSISRSQPPSGFLTDDRERGTDAGSGGQPPMPRILIRLAGVLGALHEQDPGISRLGGEPTRALAMLAMRTQAATFFSSDLPSLPSSWEPRKLSSWHRTLGSSLVSSHLQVVACPVTVVYEEGTSIGPGFASNYAAMTTVTLGKVSLVEFLGSEQVGEDLIHLVRFNSPMGDQKLQLRKNPDVKVVCKDTYELDKESHLPTSSVSVTLNPCSLDLDLGLVDRTYLVLNYADMDPDFVRTSRRPEGQDVTSESESNMSVSLSCASVSLAFHVPKPDMRNPDDAGLADFLKTFWTRQVHPEVFQVQIEDLLLKVSQGCGSLSPLVIDLSTSALEINYQESAESGQQAFPLVQARRLVRDQQLASKTFALELKVTVCMDDSLKLQGRFNSQDLKSARRRSSSSSSPNSEDSASSYFVVDPEVTSERQKPSFLQQQADILAALKQAVLRNNLLIDIKLDAVSLVVPSKRLYEVVYNRLGNDMLLWLPQYLAVKEYLYGEKVPDPLHDDAVEFSGAFSGRPQAISQEVPRKPKHTTAFPKDRENGVLEIHTDTAVTMAVNQAQILLCLPMESEPECLGLLAASATGLSLVSAVGLDREPEISIFTLRLAEGCVKYGVCRRDKLPAQLHFNPDIGDLGVLVTSNSYCDRAWPSRHHESDLLNLTAKILLDTTSNLKSIQLAFKLVHIGLCLQDPSSSPDWINALADFFTVVEFPVLGYLPPAVLTEMHFQLVQCAVELAPPPVSPLKAAICLGKVGVSCSLLDTTQDASVSVSVEDVGLYVSKDSVSPTEAAVCVADIDYLDLSVTLNEPEIDHLADEGLESVNKIEPTLLVSASTNLVRVRTCTDTIQLLAELAAGMADSQTHGASQDQEQVRVEGDDVTLEGEHSEDMLPDLEDAMVELSQQKVGEKEKGSKTSPSQQQQGAQVFFFPGEKSSPPLNSNHDDPMTRSMYVGSGPHLADSTDEESSDLESFCILEEEEGSGIIPSGGGPAIRVLAEETINIVDNHFQVPDAAVDHLKSPKGFPQPLLKLSLTKLSLVWQIFGGNDFSASKEMKVNTRARLEQLAGLVPGTASLREANRQRHNVNNGLNSAIRAADSLKTRGGPGRNSDLLIEVAVSKMAALHEVFPLQEGEADSPVTRQVLLVPQLEVRDKLAGSEINKLLHGYSSKTRPRQSSASMFHVKCLTVRPDPDSGLEETSLKVSLQPFRLNIDQDTLFFIIDFVNTLVPPSPDQPSDLVGLNPTDLTRNSPSPVPGQSIKFNSGMQAIQIEVPEGAEVFEDARSSPPKSPPRETATSTPRSKSATPCPGSSHANIYFKSFVFSPSVPIRIDYVGKYVDLTQGAITGILAGLAQLNCSELNLKQLELKQGILGVDKLLATAATAWLADIRSSQLPALLGGVGPMHAFLQLLTGIRDLILLPIEQYRKDGRIVRGLQKGTTSFTHSTTLSFLDVTNKFLTVIKFAAELAFDVMSPDSCVVQGKLPHPASQNCKRKVGRAVARRARGTPADFREGMLGAMALVREGLDETARSLAEAAAGGERGGGMTGVLRAVPSTMVRPVILGAAATSNLLDGMKNQISPDQRVEEEEKWRTDLS